MSWASSSVSQIWIHLSHRWRESKCAAVNLICKGGIILASKTGLSFTGTGSCWKKNKKAKQICIYMNCFKHFYSSWQVWWALLIRFFFHSWESAPIMLVNTQLIPFSDSILVKRLDIKTFYYKPKPQLSSLKTDQTWTFQKTLNDMSGPSKCLELIFCQAPCRVLIWSSEIKYSRWSHVFTSRDVFSLGKRLSAVIKCLY